MCMSIGINLFADVCGDIHLVGSVSYDTDTNELVMQNKLLNIQHKDHDRKCNQGEIENTR